MEIRMDERVKDAEKMSVRIISPGGQDCCGIPAGVRAAELPPERLDEFSDAPYKFEESAQMLWDDTQLTYHHACTANRFSEAYLKLSARLEKNIRQVGSYCMTRAVLEQKGLVFPDLASMSIRELLRMVSFHMRKSHAAFRGIYRENDLLGMAYLNWEFRWVELGERLKATEVRIEKVRQGKVNVDAMLSPGEITGSKRNNAAGMPSSLRISRPRINPAALPILGSAAREMLRAEKEYEKQKRDTEKKIDALYKLWQTDPKKPAHKSQIDALECEPVFPLSTRNEETGQYHSEFLTEEQARQILLEDAVKKGDREAAGRIPKESSRKIESRWIHYLEKRGPGSADP